jgi:hypothetical protein
MPADVLGEWLVGEKPSNAADFAPSMILETG